MTISGDENIFPAEVENCVGSHPRFKRALLPAITFVLDRR